MNPKSMAGYVYQENVFSNEENNYIEKLDLGSYHNIVNVQKFGIPHIITDFVLESRNKYVYNGKSYKATSENMTILYVSNLPFSNNINNFPLFIETMINSTKKGYIRPFCLFLNGKFVKWTNITIVKDYKDAYIILKNYTEKIENYTLLELPPEISYSENNVYAELALSDSIGLFFDGEGKYCSEDVAFTKIIFNSKNIVFDSPVPVSLESSMGEQPEEYSLLNYKYTFRMLAKGFEDIPTSPINIIEFTNDGLIKYNNVYGYSTKFTTSTIDGVDNKYLCLGMGRYVLFTDSNKDYEPDVLLGDLMNTKFLVFGDIKNNKYMASVSNDFNYKNKLLDYFNSDVYLEFYLSIADGTYNSLYYGLEDETATNVEQSTQFGDRMSNMVYNLHKIDDHIFDKIYKDRSLIESVEYTGKEIKELVGDSNRLKMYRKVYKGLDCYVIIFKNNRLYEEYSSIKYEGKSFSVIMTNIEDDDKFEFLFIKYIKNNSSHIVIDKGDPVTIVKTSAYYDLENCSLFSVSLENSKFPIRDRDLVEYSTIKYEVPFTATPYDGDEEYQYEVTLNDEFYYGKSLFIAHNRQFRYCSYEINADCLGVTLSPDFRYCHNIDKYMVYINGLLIPKENVTLTIMNADNPFDELALYTNIMMHKGDKIDIFYMPFELNNINRVETDPAGTYEYYIKEIPENGIIKFDRQYLYYPLSNDLYLFYINGSKIFPSDMVNLSTTVLRFLKNVDSTIDLQILYHIPYHIELNRIFSLQTDDSSSEIKDFREQYIEKLLLECPAILDSISGPVPTLTNNRARVADEAINMTKLRYEIYKNFFSEFGTNEIPYSFNEEERLTENYDVDKAGNFIIRSSDTSMNEKADMDRSDTNNGEEEKSHYGR